MFANRKIKLSFKDTVKGLFTNPPAGSGFSAFNVYGEEQLRDRKHKPVRPFIYIIDNRVMFTELNLPIVIIELGALSLYPFQIGDARRRRHFSGALNVLGRSRGEREDLADFIQQNLAQVPIKDYDDPATPTLTTAEIDDLLSGSEVTVGEGQSIEGTLTNFIVIPFSFYVDPWD